MPDKTENCNCDYCTTNSFPWKKLLTIILITYTLIRAITTLVPPEQNKSYAPYDYSAYPEIKEITFRYKTYYVSEYFHQFKYPDCVLDFNDFMKMTPGEKLIIHHTDTKMNGYREEILITNRGNLMKFLIDEFNGITINCHHYSYNFWLDPVNINLLKIFLNNSEPVNKINGATLINSLHHFREHQKLNIDYSS